MGTFCFFFLSLFFLRLAAVRSAGTGGLHLHGGPSPAAGACGITRWADSKVDGSTSLELVGLLYCCDVVV